MCAQVAPSGEYLRGHGRVRLTAGCGCFAPFVAAFARARPCYSGLRVSLFCSAWQLVVVAFCQLLMKDYYYYYYHYTIR